MGRNSEEHFHKSTQYKTTSDWKCKKVVDAKGLARWVKDIIY
jgi:hypothetical protein